MNRAKRLLALCAALVMLLTVSAFPVMAAGTVSLQAPPAPEAIEISSDRVSLSVEVSAEDSNAQIQYRMSRDKLLWNSWRTEPTFDGLQPETVYYFQARYISSDVEQWSDSAAGAVLSLTTAAQAEIMLPKLTEPKLKSSIYVVKHNEIQLHAIGNSVEDPDAVALYRISQDGTNWGEWQTQFRFSGLTGSTVYYFQAMYRAADTDNWADSEPSNIVTYTTKATGITAKLRVIGTTMPEGEIDFSADTVDYNGAVHQNWVQTMFFDNLSADTNIYTFVTAQLTAQGFTVQHSINTMTSISAPELFGGQTLKHKGYQDSGNSGWVYNIYDKDGNLRAGYGPGLDFAPSSFKVRDGETILVYYVFDKTKEVSGKRNIFADAWLHATPDAGREDYELAYGTEDLIDQIGMVSASSGSRIGDARNAYDTLSDVQKSLVRNYEVLTAAEARYEEVDGVLQLETPKLSQKPMVRPNSVILSVEKRAEMDQYAIVQYRLSEDGERWHEWQNSGVFNKLRSSATYYFQSRFWPSDTALYQESEPSEVLTVTTGKAEEYTAATRAEWLSLVNNAPTDGTEIVINITQDIEVGVQSQFTTTTPGGSNITLVGKGGSLLSPGGGQKNNGICVGNGATLTLRDITYSSIGPWGIAYGIEQETGNANFGSMIYMGGSDCTVNLENVTMYGDCTQTGVIIGNGTNDISYENNTINIYSGTLDQLGGGSVGDISGYKPCVLIAANGCTVNLRPTGDIVMEGVIVYDNVYVIPRSDTPICAASMLSGDFSEYIDMEDQLEAMNDAREQKPYKVVFSSCGGLRIETTEAGSAIPQKLAAPDVAQVDFVVDKAHVTVPSDPVSSEQSDAVLQYRVYELGEANDIAVLPYEKWMSRPMTFDIDLEENTEYRFELRYNAIGGDYCNSDSTEVILRTGYTSARLIPPRLVTADSKTTDSIVLAEPAPSSQDDSAVIEYRVSEDGTLWQPWQASPAFTGLSAGRIYYFQARYKPNSAPWELSDAGNVLEVMTKYETLSAPTLSGAAETTANSVTLQEPAPSKEDAEAIAQYRVSADGVDWGNWQSSPTFVGLQPDTTYYFQARYQANAMGWLNSEACGAITVKTQKALQLPTFRLSETSGQLGEIVQVELRVENNSGLAMAKLTVGYDSSKLELQAPDAAAVGSIMTGCLPGPVGGDSWNVILYTADQHNTTDNGTLLTLSFRIKEICTEGDLPITLQYQPGDVLDERDEELEFVLFNGKITVTSETAYGDVNGDGVTDTKDQTALTRYLAGREETIYGEAADLNQDGSITVLDLIILRRHLAGWAVYAALPYRT